MQILYHYNHSVISRQILGNGKPKCFLIMNDESKLALSLNRLTSRFYFAIFFILPMTSVL